jgi:hypothetical protein
MVILTLLLLPLLLLLLLLRQLLLLLRLLLPLTFLRCYNSWCAQSLLAEGLVC